MLINYRHDIYPLAKKEMQSLEIRTLLYRNQT